ncbi:MAG: DUF5606 domain-containing protein [Bacteroidota bacterium]|nr:DUF5606 domain-containing protein [Bacteroidota bacterium]
MNLKEIISITGKPGLYKVIAQATRGFIVESIDEKKSRTSISSNHQVAMLSEITIYSIDEESIMLADIFLNLKKIDEEGTLPQLNADARYLQEMLAKVAPTYDTERVYNSDIKKLLKWYNILEAANLLIEETQEVESTDAQIEVKVAESIEEPLISELEESKEEEMNTENTESTENEPESDDPEEDTKTAKVTE